MPIGSVCEILEAPPDSRWLFHADRLALVESVELATTSYNGRVSRLQQQRKWSEVRSIHHHKLHFEENPDGRSMLVPNLRGLKFME
jgi:hypothetical protein